MHHILLVEDEDIIRTSLRKMLERNAYSVSEAVSVKAARESFNLHDFSLIISDLRLPGEPGTDLIRLAGAVPVLIMTSYASLRSAVDSMRQGAVDYISKPFAQEDMLAAVKRIIANRAAPQRSSQPAASNKSIAGSSPAICRVFDIIQKVAPTDVAVLIQGETGTGKELIARAIHDASPRADKSFVSINCARINAVELEQQIADAPQQSTVFLDNLAELALEVQPSLLGIIKRGGYRFIGSTDRDLQSLCQSASFRDDLFFRINVVHLQVPPLRERGNDVLELADRFLADFSPEQPRHLTPDALQALSSHNWPGNVLELRNVLQQAAILTDPGQPICHRLLGNHLRRRESANTPKSENPSKVSCIDEEKSELSLEDYFTHFVLEHQDELSETELARRLGISRKCLWERRQKLGLRRKKSQ